MYSLGVIAYQMFTGTRPFSGTDPVALMLAHLNQPAPDPRDSTPGLPAAMAVAVMRALRKNPQRRYHSASELMAALRSTDELDETDREELPPTVLKQPQPTHDGEP